MKNHEIICFFVLLIVLSAVFLAVNSWASQWKKITVNTEKLFGNYVTSHDSTWLFFLPNNNLQKEFVAINLIEAKQFPVRVSERILGNEYFNMAIHWSSDNEAILRSARQGIFTYFKLEILGLKVSVKKLPDFRDKNIDFISVNSETDNFFSDDDSVDRGELAKSHPEILFKKTWGHNMTVFYGNRLVAEYKKRGGSCSMAQEPYFNGLAVSANNRYIFYGISWSGGDWNVGPEHLYLLDTRSKNVTLVDEHYNSNTPELMIWTRDSKKFVYRRNNIQDHTRSLALITF
jgi:hypothetical protein